MGPTSHPHPNPHGTHRKRPRIAPQLDLVKRTAMNFFYQYAALYQANK